MIYKPKLNCHKKRPAVFIYTVVFNSSFSVLLILLLFLSFTVQPIHQAYANEVLVEDEENKSIDEVIPEDVEPAKNSGDQAPETPSALDEDTSDIDDADESDSVQESPDNLTDSSDSAEQLAEDSETGDEVEVNGESDNANITNQDNSTSSNQSNLSVSTTTIEASSTEDYSPGNPEESSDSYSEADNDSNNQSEQPLASSTSSSADETNDNIHDGEDTGQSPEKPELVDEQESDLDNQPNVTEVQSLVTEDNYYQFNRQSCVAIGDGTFHCGVNTGVRADVNAVVYAELGDKLNMEIFLKSSDGEVKQITSNDYDDTAPHYDAESMQIVWQRLIDDRYQIVLYDLEEGDERQLTFSRSNNMEPKVSDQGIVWQAWDGNDWEIMYFDGTFTDQLTDNSVQDVAPAVDDGYVLWSVLGADEQEAKVYSLDSGETLNITGYEGGVIANPRFVLVYDTKFDNGDIITQGFDPTTGLSEPIAAKAADDPIDIPDSDSTGETRALIQNKSSQEEDYDDGLTKKNPDLSNNSSSTATSTSSLADQNTLNLTEVTPTATSTTANNVPTSTEEVSDDVLELTDFDLILINPATTTDNQTTDNSATGSATTT